MDIDMESESVELYPEPSPPRQFQINSSTKRDESPKTRLYPNPFLMDDYRKMSTRASRFGLSAADGFAVTGMDDSGSSASSAPTTRFSDEDVSSLYLDMGVTDGLRTNDSKVRLDSVLIRGTNKRSTSDIFKYLYNQNQKPLQMEWVNDACCIVMFNTNEDAAQCLLTISKPILPVQLMTSSEELNDSDQDAPDKEASRMSRIEEFDFDNEAVIPADLILVPMPPGNSWRYANTEERGKGFLLRFALASDKKQQQAERHSEYYKTHGNPNWPKNRSPRTQKQPQTKPDSESEEEGEILDDDEPTTNRNAWATLSHNWGNEEYKNSKGVNLRTPPRQEVIRSHPEDDSIKNIRIMVDGEPPILSRLKRRHESSSSSSEDNISNSNSDNSEDDEDVDNSDRVKLKARRMRMHADDEEARLRRCRILDSLKKSTHSRIGGHNETGPGDLIRRRVRIVPRRPVHQRLGATPHAPYFGGRQRQPFKRGRLEGGFDLRDHLQQKRQDDNDEAQEGDHHPQTFVNLEELE